MLVVMRERWSIENGCLTPTLKILKRRRIEAMLEQELRRLVLRAGRACFAA